MKIQNFLKVQLFVYFYLFVYFSLETTLLRAAGHLENFPSCLSFRELDAQFDLVLILERFDESLVLLQDLMCWPTEDIVYLKQNERIATGSLF